MNSRKRNKLKAKRKPWIKSRYSSNFFWRGINFRHTYQEMTKSEFERLYLCTFDAVDQVPLYGSKTV